MSEFRVQVQKKYTLIGSIIIDAEDIDDAKILVSDMIDAGEIETQDPNIEWDVEQEYDDFSFETTGEAEEI